MSKWCFHLDSESFITTIDREGSTRYEKKNINFCPICGTPCPKERSLAEKFNEHLKALRVSDSVALAYLLAGIAEEHFRENK